MPNVKILVLSHPLGYLGLTHRGHLWLDGKRIVNFLLVLIERFSPALTVVVFERVVRHFEHKFQGKGRSSSNDCRRQKTRVPGILCGIVCVILRLAVLI